MPKAYSYLRFSTPEQMKGDSFRRQTDAAQKYAHEHGLELDDKLTFQDLGVSAFRGSNLEDGQLGAFLRAVQEGKVEPGSYLLVESLDRISRQTPYLALGPLTSILGHGITLVTLNDRKVYSHATMTAQPFDLMYAIMGFVRANEESATKSIRLKASWAQKRATVAQKPLTSTSPAWLRFDKATGKFEVIHERADVVRRMFRDYLAGHSAMSITKALNQEGVPVFARESHKAKVAKHWHRSYVRLILENPAVIGTYTAFTTEYEGRTKKRRRATLDPVPNYFPAIIDEDTFQRAQALRLDTPCPLRGRNATRQEVKNIFGGLAQCGQCGSTMVYTSKGQYKGRKYTYLVCNNARDGAGCKYRLVPYGQLEAMFVQDAPRLLDSAPTGPENGPLDDEIRQVQNNLEAIGFQLSDLAEAYVRTKSDTLLKKIRELEQAQKEAEQQRDDLYLRAGAVADRFVIKRIGELEEALKADSLDRRKVNALMRMVFSKVTVHPHNGTADFAWKHGGDEETVLFGFPEDAAA